MSDCGVGEADVGAAAAADVGGSVTWALDWCE